MARQPGLQPFLNSSLSIRQEIQRFESVHPSIYAIYDLIELIPDGLLGQQIRDHVVCIEDSFVNSQEWTVGRSVGDLRVGVLGAPSSGKSALVHRYLTGAYMHEDSPEGGRFKKEVVIDGHSYLLLIRDEGGPPEMQFTTWVDAVIFVFSLESESSFNAVYTYYSKMSHYRNSAEIPLILVGTQDGVSESNPRAVEDSRARKLASDLRRCSYYETCATYGLNVERVFQDACQKIVGSRLSASTQCLAGGSRPGTPQPTNLPHSPSHNHPTFLYKDSLSRGHHTLSASSHHLHRAAASLDASSNSSGISSSHTVEVHNNGTDVTRWAPLLANHASTQGLITITTENNNIAKFTAPQLLENLQPPIKDSKDLPTPTSTPTTSRKSRRRSNLFTPSKKGDDKLKNGELGSGRAIPLKQGYLYKKSSKALNKEWKKKYVTLCDDGRLTYHPSLHDYMEDVNGKEISLQYVTVKVPGQKPRGSKSIITTVPGGYQPFNNDIQDSIGGLSLSNLNQKDGRPPRVTDKALLSAFEVLKEPGSISQISGRLTIANQDDLSSSSIGSGMGSTGNSMCGAIGSTNGTDGKAETPHVKKRHRRMKSSGVKKDGEDECDWSTTCEFTIVSLAGKRWRFEVSGGASAGANVSAAGERDAWVTAIEQQILSSLQGRSSGPTGANGTAGVDAAIYIRRVKGNGQCVDCGANDPDWASLNLGVLICIECSGIHRNLGSHISRVRSLDLDEWPLGHVSVMVSIGNALANSIWEADLRGCHKPVSASTREEKERWIRLKYERRYFVCTESALGGSETAAAAAVAGLCSAAALGCVRTLARLLAGGAGSAATACERAQALRNAAARGHLAASQLLLWHNANPNLPDSENRTCLHYARSAAASLASRPEIPPTDLQLTCPTHGTDPPVTNSNTSSSSGSVRSIHQKGPDPDCYCIITQLLTAHNAANALVQLLVNLQNNSIVNSLANNGSGLADLNQSQNGIHTNESQLGSAVSLNGSTSTISGSFGPNGTIGRTSLGNNLSLSNGKCTSGSMV